MKIISKPVQISDRQRGFTLLEVLIAVMLLAVGLLGLAGLQAVSLRNNHSAYLRSQATMLTYEIIDGMRTNRSAAQPRELSGRAMKSPSGPRRLPRRQIVWLLSAPAPRWRPTRSPTGNRASQPDAVGRRRGCPCRKRRDRNRSVDGWTRRRSR